MRPGPSLFASLIILLASLAASAQTEPEPRKLYPVPGHQFPVALPAYTEDAKRNQVTGTVVLKVVFNWVSDITNIRIVSGLPFGLTERAIDAAKKTKFIPAVKDGHYVSMWMQLEYYFNLP